ncbi:MAG TPA: glycosyltransferase [Patescibacteria group bacterium]|nr:glycosyltransferase [Patescibacteria group bacterium]
MTQKKKIIHIIQSLENGGCENMLLRTLPLLQDFEHKIITLKTFGELTPKFVSAGIAVETIHCRGFFDISGIRRLQKTVKEENPDIIITYLFHADMLGRLALCNISQTPIIPFLRTTYNHPKYLVARILEWLTRPLVNQYLANSEAVKNFYVDTIGVRPEKITVIPNGINIEYFNSITPDSELKKSLGIDPDDFVIICVANLHINKGHQYLLEAFERLRTSSTTCHPGPDPGSSPKQKLKLLLVGDGEERKKLEQQIESYRSKNNILFLGKRSDVSNLLKISNLFILPTLFEGMSNAIMEAMACELPIITTGINENKELIENNQTGILVPTKSSEAIYKAIKTILENPELRKNLSKNAKLFIGESFSLNKIATEWSLFLNNHT